MTYRNISALASLGVAASALLAGPALASSHREAPFIAGLPRVDGTDLYMFRSYEPGRDGFVTLIANYIPLQDPYGGPNYFKFDPTARYEIHIDNDGDGVEDMTFEFQFTNDDRGLAVQVDGNSVPIPFNNAGPVGASGSRNDIANLNVQESFTLGLIRGQRQLGRAQPVTNAADGKAVFKKPVDFTGTRSQPSYAAYARDHIYNINIPGCAKPGRLFVGQRAEPFNISVGQVFDLLNFSTITVPPTTLENNLVTQNMATPFIPAGEANKNAGENVVRNKNISSLELELPISCVTTGKDPVIGAWTTSSLPAAQVFNSMSPHVQEVAFFEGDFVQVSRLGMPLVNELVIGLPDKDRFNSSAPVDDAQFAKYVQTPSLPTVIEALFGPNGSVSPLGLVAPTLFPRTDLVAAFLTGIDIPGVVSNQPKHVHPAEMLRLNTSTPVTPLAQQSRLGVIGGDVAGFPNGRRPGDDIVDVTLRVAEGRLISLGLFGTPGQAPVGNVDFTDGAASSAAAFDASFPYLKTPYAGNLAGGGN
jgi:hypothetical protein